MLFKATAILLPTDSQAGTRRSEADGSRIPPIQPSSKESFFACFALGSMLITSTSRKLRFLVVWLTGFVVKQLFHLPTFLRARAGGALVAEPIAGGALVTEEAGGAGGALVT